MDIPNSSNIVSITYQLLQEANDPTSIRAQMPVITIQFIDGNSVLRTKAVSFQEMLPYLTMLKNKCIVLGESLVSFPDLTFDKKIVIGHGVPPVPSFTGNVTFKDNGINFAGGNNLSNVVNTTGAGVATRAFSASTFVVRFLLPVITNNLLNDYNIVSGLSSVIAAVVGIVGSDYDVKVTGIAPANGNYNIDFVPTGNPPIGDFIALETNTGLIQLEV